MEPKHPNYKDDCDLCRFNEAVMNGKNPFKKEIAKALTLLDRLESKGKLNTNDDDSLQGLRPQLEALEAEGDEDARALLAIDCVAVTK